MRSLWILLLVPALCAAAERTYSQDIRPILEARCVNCHQPGGAGPMPLTSYKEARPWSRAIREAVVSRTMPPWHAAPGSAHAFRNDRSLAQAEIDSLVAWVDAGSPEGMPVSETRVAAPVDSKWRLGKPDVVIQVPGLKIPKSGVMQYTFLIVPVHIERDTWVRAAEF